MEIYEQEDYRNVLVRIFESRKKKRKSLTRHRLARSLGVHGPYLSKVFSHMAHLSSDQLFLANQFLKTSPTERQWLNLLYDLNRSNVPERQTELRQKMNRMKQDHLKTEQYIPTTQPEQEPSQYYLNPWLQIVHLFLSIERYQQNPKLLAKELELSSEKIDSALEQLQSMGIVRWKDGKYVNLNKKMHLSKDSPLCHPNQQLLRIMSMQKLEQLRSQSDDQQYNVAITYSATPQAHHRIRERFLEFLKEFDEILEQSENKCVYQMNFDLFSWSQN